jgi:hypothetical protein
MELGGRDPRTIPVSSFFFLLLAGKGIQNKQTISDPRTQNEMNKGKIRLLDLKLVL